MVFFWIHHVLNKSKSFSILYWKNKVLKGIQFDHFTITVALVDLEFLVGWMARPQCDLNSLGGTDKRYSFLIAICLYGFYNYLFFVWFISTTTGLYLSIFSQQYNNSHKCASWRLSVLEKFYQVLFLCRFWYDIMIFFKAWKTSKRSSITSWSQIQTADTRPPKTESSG